MTHAEPVLNNEYPFLKGGGEMGLLTRSFHWDKTTLGSPDGWPQSLKTTISIILNSKFPMFLWWGPELICFYNDAYRPSLGENGKHPSILGMPAIKAWPEIWDVIKPLIDQVLAGGESTWSEDQLIPIYRNGKMEDVYWTFSYSPVTDESGKPAGVFVTCNETTGKVLAIKNLEENNKQLHAAMEAERLAQRRIKENERNLRLIKIISGLELQRAEEMLRFSVEAANAATWYMDAESREFIPSPRLKELFGFHPDAVVTYEDVIAKIPDNYQEKINVAIQKAVANDENYSIEHPINGQDGKKLWVRALGKLYPAAGNRKAHFSGLIIDITEQKQDELRKNDFIAMASHELKTPLTSLTAIVQVLNAKLKNNDDAFIAGAIDKVNVQAKKMGNMINGFLNISRLEAGEIHLQRQDFDLPALVEEIIIETKLTVATHAITLISGKSIQVNADRDKIGSVISNLLSNAVKYSPKGKVIEVRCEVVGKNAQVSIKDEGMGIKSQDREKLFDRYYRVENNHTRHISGFGIGLFLSAEIIYLHYGKIWVESESGIGSTFYFTVPLSL